MKNQMVELGLGIVIFAIVILIGFGMWTLARKVNYSVGYRSMVEQTVREMVKEECLKK